MSAVAAAGDPWEAHDYLSLAGGARPARGGRGEVLFLTREAVAGEMESRVRFGAERAHGFGGDAAWSRYWPRGGPAADDAEIGFIWRGPGLRLRVGGGVVRRGSDRLGRLAGSGHVRLFEALLVGAGLRLHPSLPAAAPDLRATLHAAWAGWWAGLELGPGARDLAAGFGVRLNRALAWTATWTGSTPRVGLAWRLGLVELRVGSARHPLLGAVNDVRVLVGGAGP